MAQNPPTQPPAQPPVAQAQSEEQVIIVRGSEEHKDYLKHQFGRIKDTVNSFETRIAVAGRALLLVYVVYITVKAAVSSSLPHNMAPWLTAALLLLDIVMQALQVLGLEGSVPGLTHLAGELEDKGKHKEARTVRLAANTAQWLLALTAIDIVLESNHNWGGVDISGIAAGYTNGLFIVRVIVIGLYLVAMARLEHKGPKVVSAHEAARIEQEQVRMDNAAIQASINVTLDAWTKGQNQHHQARLDEAMARWMEQQAQKLDERFASLANQAGQAPDLQAILQAVSTYLAPQFQALNQAMTRQNATVDQALSRQNAAIAQALAQATRVPEQPRPSGAQATNLRQFKPRPQAPAQGIQGDGITLQINPETASREEMIAEAKRLQGLGLSTYQIGEKLNKSPKTVQSWLSNKPTTESGEVEVVNG